MNKRKLHRFILWVVTIAGPLWLGHSSAAFAQETGSSFNIEFQTDDGTTAQSESLWAPVNSNDISKEFSNRQTPINSEPLVILSLESLSSEALKLKNELTRKGIKSEMVLIPDASYQAIEVGAQSQSQISNQVSKKDRQPASKISQVKKLVRSLFSKPTAKDLFLGSTITLYKGAISLQWFALGMNPWYAASVAVGSTLMAAHRFIWFQAYDRLYSASLHSLEKHNSFLAEILTRQTLDIILAESIRALSGPITNAHSVMTLAGQGEILSHVAAFGLGGRRFQYCENPNL